ncbi:phosphoribosyl-AMP cyclohydrolase [Taklimakanibacter albus]|uniref:Phosphoribosyl-AMP cyclohydrolase n=1 Tax=Taklimakanibacter albus TaxID=2800327 RepID=A0ACC5QXF2_9HYPH|nr:phosphoribosyl-AMP cyclohydrolase [Aestuariivirga sp. YIM B02566]MBK1865066.1 phosphoribosyl-AMP cyclohydrolase [Aestuariivirga sp. YIM B02566]
MSKGDEESTVFAPRYDDKGLIPAIVTDAKDGAVVMLAYMNAEALRLTLETGEAHYWSRSRGELWRKGATSGDTQKVVDLRLDCDQDTVLVSVAMAGRGVACHTGRHSCFYRRVKPSSQGYELEII